MVQHSVPLSSLSLKDWTFQKIFKVTGKDNNIVNKHLKRLKEVISSSDKMKILKINKHMVDSFFTMLQEVILSKQIWRLVSDAAVFKLENL